MQSAKKIFLILSISLVWKKLQKLNCGNHLIITNQTNICSDKKDVQTKNTCKNDTIESKMSFSIWNLFQLKKFYNDFPFFDRSSSYCKQIVRTEPAILPNHRTEFDLDGRKKLHLRERAENVDLLLMSACLKVSKSQKHFFLKLHCPKNERNIWQNSVLAS